MSRCAACHTRIEAGDAAEECPDCRHLYHADCWRELGGCATFGCARAVTGEKPPAPAMVGGGWGDSKICPSCGTTIGASLLVCGCGARFPWPEPIGVDEYQGWLAERNKVKELKILLVTLFVLSLTGLLAPLVGLAAGIVAWRQRRRLAGADGTFLALGYGTAVIGATYTLTILLLLAGA